MNWVPLCNFVFFCEKLCNFGWEKLNSDITKSVADISVSPQNLGNNCSFDSDEKSASASCCT
jgi:hypothetical protein